MARENKFLKYLGIILMVLGPLIVLSAFPLVQQVIVQAGPIKADIPTISATRIIIGAVLFFLGLGAYKVRRN